MTMRRLFTTILAANVATVAIIAGGVTLELWREQRLMRQELQDYARHVYRTSCLAGGKEPRF